MNKLKPSASVFVDVQNIYYTCKQVYQKQFNYRFLWSFLSRNYSLNVANAYAIESNNEGQRKFQSALRQIGFNVKLKPYIQRSDGSAKGDWDVGITLDVVDEAQHVENIFLLSGDGDFDLLLKRINHRNKVTTHVVGVHSLTANSLITSCSDFIPITDDMLQ